MSKKKISSKIFIPYEKRVYVPLGPKSNNIIRKADKFSAPNYPAYPFVVKRAKGPWLFDPEDIKVDAPDFKSPSEKRHSKRLDKLVAYMARLDPTIKLDASKKGNSALDFLAAYSAILSHKDPKILWPVLKEHIFGSDLPSRAVYNEKYAMMVEKIAEVTGYDMTVPKSDGGSATDAALKGLFMHAGKRGIKKPNIILTTDYFHGRSLAFVSCAEFDQFQKADIPIKTPGIRVVKDNLESIERAINSNTIGIFIETHKGEAGPLFTTKEHYMGIRKLARKKGIFMGCDEIQTGLGRCGYMMAWQEFVEKGEKFRKEEARPDFITLGKALGGGVHPVSAVVGTKEFMGVFGPNTDGCTWGGNPLASIAAFASLDYIVKENIAEKANEVGDYFVENLQGISGINVENRGALVRVEIEGIKTAKYACLEMLLGKGRNPRVLMKHGHYDPKKDVAYTRIAPPIGAMTKELIDYAVENTIKPVLSNAAKR